MVSHINLLLNSFLLSTAVQRGILEAYLTNINDVEDEPVEELEDVIAEDDVIHNAEKPTLLI